MLKRKTKKIVTKRKDNKPSAVKKTKFKHEVNTIFNKFYKEQVTALYKELTRKS